LTMNVFIIVANAPLRSAAARRQRQALHPLTRPTRRHHQSPGC
jgi:hypothetical protein